SHYQIVEGLVLVQGRLDRRPQFRIRIKVGGMMRINRIDHIGVIVEDLAAAKAFFLDFGLEVQGEADMEGELVDRLLGLRGVKTSLVMMRPPGGEASIELMKFHSPSDQNGVQL